MTILRTPGEYARAHQEFDGSTRLASENLGVSRNAVWAAWNGLGLKVKREEIAKPDYAELFRLTDGDLAETARLAGRHPDHVKRVLRSLGLIESPETHLTRDYSRVDWLLQEGLPATWITDDTGYSYSVVTGRRVALGVEAAPGWPTVWHQIRKSPAEFEIHKEIAPKSRQQTLTERDLENGTAQDLTGGKRSS